MRILVYIMVPPFKSIYCRCRLKIVWAQTERKDPTRQDNHNSIMRYSYTISQRLDIVTKVMSKTMLRRSIHTTRILKNSNAAPHIWSDFSKRPSSLSIQSPKVKNYLFQEKPYLDPPSIKRRSNRIKYSSPEHMDEIFKMSYDFLEQRASKFYDLVNKTKNPLKRDTLLTKAEINNPEVQYNFQFNDKLDNIKSIIDYDVPVYRHLGKQHWESYGQMLLMQRLETLAAIPDTLPTLVPRAEVNIKFPFSTGVNKWIEPGEFLSSNVTSMCPVLKVQEYDHVDVERQLYTILVVNPDVPDLNNDSFKTALCYGLANIKLSYNDNLIDPRKFNSSNILADYLPPVPEKNAGKQRFVAWVFRQPLSEDGQNSLEVSQEDINRDEFDIRQFTKKYNLDPIGAHIWRSEWDVNVAVVREKYGLPPGRVFSRVRR
ncbi:mitochondrial 54S ribosomal protein mL38 [Saccharomyces eubayanus]|uniref:mitochondrial 54S ribosomal protein mL38 n=1 Tax=Saccharomyces eubayanus TaxID=1080349 RepID=UPI0006C172FA|nr:MRPL35-like protein [Saccharomyces eubayanus]KOH01149.1 MRPL35-like protein [Saccharomyces eubayanus]